MILDTLWSWRRTAMYLVTQSTQKGWVQMVPLLNFCEGSEMGSMQISQVNVVEEGFGSGCS